MHPKGYGPAAHKFELEFDFECSGPKWHRTTNSRVASTFNSIYSIKINYIKNNQSELHEYQNITYLLGIVNNLITSFIKSKAITLYI